MSGWGPDCAMSAVSDFPLGLSNQHFLYTGRAGRKLNSKSAEYTLAEEVGVEKSGREIILRTASFNSSGNR